MAYEPTVADIYPLLLAFPVDDLAPPFCFSTIFRHDVELNTTNEFDTITSIGYRMPPDQQDLTVPFKVEVGPAVRVTYFDATAEFPYVTRLGPESFTYLTVCITGSGPFTISAYEKGCEVNTDTLPPVSVNANPDPPIPTESTFVYMGEEQAAFDVRFACLRL